MREWLAPERNEAKARLAAGRRLSFSTGWAGLHEALRESSLAAQSSQRSCLGVTWFTGAATGGTTGGVHVDDGETNILILIFA